MPRRALACLVAVALLVPLAACGEVAPVTPIAQAAESPAKGTADGTVSPSVVDAATGFGFRLFGELTSATPDENVFVSPLSVSAALAMTREGAAGTTRDAMTRTLGLDGLSDAEVQEGYANLLASLGTSEGVTLEIADALFADKDVAFKEDFLAKNRDYFASQVTSLDLQAPNATEVVNAWVSERTRGRIPEIVDKLDPNAVLELLNAVYFKGEWQTAFDQRKTHDAMFTPAGRKPVSVNMMSSPTTTYTYTRQADGFQAAEIPYKGGRFGMIVILPGPASSVEAVRRQLTAEEWRRLTGAMKPAKGAIDMPRFQLDYDADLIPALSSLGMGTAFGDGADFSAMVEPPAGALYISKARHRTFASIDESGTEAAAATQVEVTKWGGGSLDFRMILDRPFLFAIRDDRTGALLFLGVVNKPE